MAQEVFISDARSASSAHSKALAAKLARGLGYAGGHRPGKSG